MRTLFLYFLFTTFLVSNFPATGTSPFEPYDSKVKLESDVRKIIADFNLFIKEMGFNPPYLQCYKIQTDPVLIRYDKTTKCVILPYWDEIPNEQKELFKTWQGKDAEQLFISLFNWFFIPHELGHFILRSQNIYLQPYENERAANEFAVAFLGSKSENQEKINYLQETIPEVLKILPHIDCGNMTEEEYFNANHQMLSREPNTYGYFQLKFILDLLNNQDKIDLQKYLNPKNE